MSRRSTRTTSSSTNPRRSKRKQAVQLSDERIYGEDYGILPSDWSRVAASAIPGRWVNKQSCLHADGLASNMLADRARGRLRFDLLTLLSMPWLDVAFNNLFWAKINNYRRCKMFFSLFPLYMFITLSTVFLWGLFVATQYQVENFTVDPCSSHLQQMIHYKVVLYRMWMKDGVQTLGAGMDEKRLGYQCVKRNMVSFTKRFEPF